MARLQQVSEKLEKKDESIDRRESIQIEVRDGIPRPESPLLEIPLSGFFADSAEAISETLSLTAKRNEGNCL